jgi:hypothetical protein
MFRPFRVIPTGSTWSGITWSLLLSYWRWTAFIIRNLFTVWSRAHISPCFVPGPTRHTTLTPRSWFPAVIYICTLLYLLSFPPQNFLIYSENPSLKRNKNQKKESLFQLSWSFSRNGFLSSEGILRFDYTILVRAALRLFFIYIITTYHRMKFDINLLTWQTSVGKDHSYIPSPLPPASPRHYRMYCWPSPSCLSRDIVGLETVYL